MARPSKTAAIDYAVTHDLTHGLLERAACPPERPFVLVKDSDKKGLRLRVTKAGGKYWQFETRLKGKLITRALGEWHTVPIGDARKEALRLRGLTQEGTDPREIERQEQAAKAAAIAQAEADKAAAIAAAAVQAEADRQAALTVGEIWPLYLQTGRPKRREAWKPRYVADLKTMSAQGGVPKQRGQGLTRPGALYPLMGMALASVNEDVLQSWFDQEAMSGKHQAARALMMFRGFLRWCASKPAYRALADREAGKSAHILDQLPSTADSKRKDALQADQVRGWWEGVEQLSNRTASAYLRALLLTGARREELAALTWANVDFQWRKLTIADKVVDTRTIPLTPYLAHLLASLPRVGPYVFASTSKTGRITDTRNSHAKVLQGAGIEKLTIHGIRRTFTQRGRQVVPSGAVAQIQGHTPSAVAEGYAVLTIDDLRPYAEKIEAHILSLADVQFDRAIEPGKLRAVG